eukprot:COSAG03_NODE_1266_length_4438_cov_8.476838_1_plen_93_part_10
MSSLTPLPLCAAATAESGLQSKISADALTPRQIFEQLEEHIIGQQKAKRAVAIALRNRYRRHALPDDFKEEVNPKNILMIGPTGRGIPRLCLS